MKEIHFYEYYQPYNPWMIYSWEDTKAAIEDERSTIHTYQMGLLSTKLFDLGYRVFIHESIDSDSYEITLGVHNERTKCDIRMGHDLFKIWQDGEFDKKKKG